MKFNCFVIDPPYRFNDALRQSKTKRSAQDQYKSTMSIDEIKALDIKSLSADNAILALWVPSAFLAEGLEIMKAYGFKFTQTWIWVKTKNQPLKSLLSILKKKKFSVIDILNPSTFIKNISLVVKEIIDEFDINSILGFGMGHTFRQTHEVCLIGTKGKISAILKNKSQRSVFLGPIGDHSEKPEGLQDMLEKMIPDGNKCELFARRYRKGWLCLGNETKMSENEHIKDSLAKISSLDSNKLAILCNSDEDKASKLWKIL